jgi:hypothetical protein
LGSPGRRKEEASQGNTAADFLDFTRQYHGFQVLVKEHGIPGSLLFFWPERNSDFSSHKPSVLIGPTNVKSLH